MKAMDDLFLYMLQDVYYAERQILKALPKMTKAAQNEQLRQAFTQHREETQGQVDRLQQVFEQIGKRARGSTCEAIQGLIEEAEEVISEFEQGPVRDAGLVACAQAVEHYEIARYGALLAWAKACGLNEAATLLEETLQEEKKTDQLLNDLANSEINQQAAKQAKAA
ncbi:Protein YciF [Rhodovastum atsumiense]|uniref:Ferritin-like domain-containing protein n=1 Tax=Rhodovastum atsumiense TaxID=504468 RepID=A0A5M6IVS7_9PROT|nr:ferritin-like domain-containing protein [Rhodovastum atsumiense]KAA5612382.1 ferritin-like domain-containing protein [Rhodovastum atsumiense]CAH2600284.1 Protein YciF [Rhodovastum atsumiense]